MKEAMLRTTPQPIARIAATAIVLCLVAFVAVYLPGCAGGARLSNAPAQSGDDADPSVVEASDAQPHDPGGTPVSAPETAAPAALAPAILESDWEFHGRAAKKYVSENYALHTTGNRSWMREYAVVFAERAISHYQTALADLPAPGRRLETFLFGERSDWQQKTRDLMGDHADLYLNLGRGGYSMHGTAVLFNIDFDDTFAILAHEGWHQYTQVTFKNPLPTWLEEGIATYMEGRRQLPGQPLQFRPLENRQRLEALERAWLNRGGAVLFPMTELIDRSPQHFLKEDTTGLLTYYAQVWALVHFFVHGENGKYRAALRRVLEDAAEGRLLAAISTSGNIPNHNERQRLAVSQFGPGILLAYFNRNYAGEMQEEYTRFLERLVTDAAFRDAMRASDIERMGYAGLN